MGQFSVYRNRNSQTRERIPYLLDVQSDLLENMSTRVVVPLSTLISQSDVLTRLTPILEIESKQYRMLTPQIAGIPINALGQEVAHLANSHDDIVAALDFLISGF